MIRTRDDDAVRVVTIDRPARRNALRPDDLIALRTAVADADAPVTYLRGAGEAFCAGADLDVVADLDDPRAVADGIAEGAPDALRAIKRRVRDRRDDGAQERAEATAFADSCAPTPTTSRRRAGSEPRRDPSPFPESVTPAGPQSVGCDRFK